MSSRIFLAHILLFTVLAVGTSCKKNNTGPVTFSYQGTWIVNYNYTTGTKVKGTFKVTFKSDGNWDYVEGSVSRANGGTWTSSGNSISFIANFSGLAKYDGSKNSDNSLSGTAVADGGVSTGTWTATRQ